MGPTSRCVFAVCNCHLQQLEVEAAPSWPNREDVRADRVFWGSVEGIGSAMLPLCCLQLKCGRGAGAGPTNYDSRWEHVGLWRLALWA